MILRDSGRAADFAEGYQTADPFPHCFVDDLFDDEALTEVSREIDRLPDHVWRKFESDRELKLGLVYPGYKDSPLHNFLAYLNSPEVLQFIETLTGIEGLIPDPYFGGGGVHCVPPGGYLAVHADFNWHPKLSLDRRVNLLIYLNKNWKESYGGCLELWDGREKRCVKKILPIFNRTAIFNTTSDSYHGHPNPLSCPLNVARKSVSIYYYTNGRPENERTSHHDTLFLDVS